MNRILRFNQRQQVIDSVFQVENQLVVARESFDIVGMAEVVKHLEDSLRRFASEELLRTPIDGSMKRPGFRGGSNTGEWSHEEVPEVFA